MPSPSELVLWQYPPAFGMPSLSPFCVKIETYLRLNGLPYDVQYTNNPKRGPFGKMPVLIDRGQTTADSRFIIDAINLRMDGGCDKYLSPKECALGHALTRMVEEHLYFAVMYLRWVDDAGFRACVREFSPWFPRGFKTLALHVLRFMLKKQCSAQGLGRLSAEQIYQLAIRDVDSLEEHLTDGSLFANHLTSFDCTVYAFLKTIVCFPVPNPVRQRIVASKTLLNFISKMDPPC